MLHTYNTLLIFVSWHLCSGIRLENVFQTVNAREIMRLSKSAEMRNYMQTSVNPCNDFYTYACGNWGKINPAHTDAKTGMFRVLTKAFNRKIAELLQAPKSTSETDMERKVKYFYESCLDAAGSKGNYRQQLISILEEFGGMPALKGSQWQGDRFDWLEVTARILRTYGKEIIIGCDISNDLTNNEVNRLYIGQLDELVISRSTDYYERLKVVHQMDLQQVLGMSVELAAKTANDIVNFERRLAAGMTEPNEGLGMEDKTRLRMLDEMSESYKPVLNFTKFVTNWLGYEYRTPVYEYVEGYQKNLCILIEETPKHIVANYIMWELLQDFRLEAEENKEKQRNKCVAATKRYFFKYLDHMVYKELVRTSQNDFVIIRQIWHSLKQAFEMTFKFNKTLWMRESTRDKALEKLSVMQLEINSYEHEDFDKEFGSLVIRTNTYFENVINIMQVRGANCRQQLHEPPKFQSDDRLSFSPAYSAEYNKVIIPVAFLQPHYLWDDVYPTALKFATVGYIIAHEMAHGFDDTTRKYDAKGNLNNWWDRNSTEMFAQRKECLRQQYSEYKYEGRMLPKMNNQAENIADNVGIRLAYDAYVYWLAEHLENLQYESLPNMSFTPRQLFFIGSAQLWCSDVNRKWRQLFATTDVHAPESVRVLAMMANFDEFAMEFNCSLGTNMNPLRKCIVY